MFVCDQIDWKLFQPALKKKQQLSPSNVGPKSTKNNWFLYTDTYLKDGVLATSLILVPPKIV